MDTTTRSRESKAFSYGVQKLAISNRLLGSPLGTLSAS